MSSSLTKPGPQEPTVHLPTRAQMYAKIAADRGLAPAARKAHEDALRARFDAEIEAARFKGVRGLAPAARLGLGGFGGSELGDDDGPYLIDSPAAHGSFSNPNHRNNNGHESCTRFHRFSNQPSPAKS
jgi:hypothetical protein